MAKSKKSKKSKKPAPVIALLIILVLLCIIIYPYIAPEEAENESGGETDVLHTVRFFDGGSEYASAEIKSGMQIETAMPDAPVKEGCIFTGWNTKEDGSGARITADTEVSADMTVYAVWSAQGIMSGNGYLSTAEQSYKVSDSFVKIELTDLNPSPNAEGTTVTLYNPGDEQKYSGSFSGTEYKLSFECGITVEFADKDSDGIMDAGEELLIQSGESFCPGIWNIELEYSGYESGSTAFRFHIFEEGTEGYEENVQIIFLDVGQADSILIITSDSRTILIDAGIPLNKTSYISRLLQQLESAEVERIDALILTHPDYDHIGGAAAVLEKYDVGKVYTCGKESTSKTYQKLMDAIDAEGCAFSKGDFEAGSYLNLSTTEAFRVLAADEYVKGDENNAASVVLRMSCASTSVLFTGDIPSEVEQTILSEYPDEVDVDILKVAHHGSRGSSCEEFLQSATPVISVISCGEDNSYGHPHEEALERLEKYSSKIIRTDLTGSWRYISSGGAAA